MELKDSFADAFEDLIFASGFGFISPESLKSVLNKDAFSFLYKYNFITENEFKKLNSYIINYKKVKSDEIKLLIKAVFKRLNLTKEEKGYLLNKIKKDFESLINTMKINNTTAYEVFIYLLSVISSIYEIFNECIIPSNIVKLVKINSENEDGLERIYNTLNNHNTNPNNDYIAINENSILISPIIEAKVNSYLIEKSVVYASYCLKKSNIFNDEE